MTPSGRSDSSKPTETEPEIYDKEPEGCADDGENTVKDTCSIQIENLDSMPPMEDILNKVIISYQTWVSMLCILNLNLYSI